MKQTAVEWLFQQLWETPKDKFTWHSILDQAKEMEKKHLCEMYIQGRNDYHLDYYPEKHAKETYDEMFKKD
jgi:hypothetical protein